MTTNVRSGRGGSGDGARGCSALVLLLALSLTGCPASTTPAIDAGSDSPIVVMDAPAIDAPVIDAPAVLDTGGGSDAGPGLDAPSDAPRADAPILAPFDTGDPFGDAGSLGPPEWVPIEVLTSGTCTPLTACGGDVTGTWDVEDACIEVPVPDALGVCPGATFEATGMARGRVTFTGTVAVRAAQSVVMLDVFVPTICASFVGGCDGIETMIQSMAPDSACRTETDGCHCQGRQQFDIDDADAYTIDTTTDEIVSTTSGKRWAYCITGDSMRYEDTSSSGSREPGIIELGSR